MTQEKHYQITGQLIHNGLTPRQCETALLVIGGYTNAEIAKQLDISPNTAEKHVGEILRRLNVRSRQQLIVLLLSNTIAEQHNYTPAEK